ncbi:unnamed protein product [Aphanomyces euteiches]
MGGSGRNMTWLHQLGNLLVKIAGAFAAFLVVVDVVYNNWELINYLGNAQYLLTPLLNHPSLVDVAASYAFPKEASPALLSEAGRFQLNDTITAAFGRNPDYYFLTAGGDLIQDASYDICGALAKSYPNVSATAATVNLGVVTNSLFYVRSTTLSNFFGMTATDVAPPKSNDATLTALGYAPARLDTDMKLTTPLAIPPSGTNMTANVTMYRFFPKSFCTGCSSSSAATNAASSTPYIGDTHLLGVILERSSASKASLYVRWICVFLAMMGYKASQKTIRWTDANVQTPWYKRLLYIFSPPLYRYSSDTYSLPDFFLNSDVVVFGYTVAILLDEKQSMVFTRQLAKWVQANDGWAQIQLFAIQFRWLWLNCAVLKCIKWFINFMSLTRQTGKNPFVGMCNFSSVIYVYLGAVFLVTRTSFIHYGNSDSVSMSATTDCIDTVRLDLFQSQYIRAFPSLILVMIVNLMAVLALDHVLHFRWWRRLKKNLLGRQAMYNLTSIFTDPPRRFLRARRWFLTYHTTSFGLVEETRQVRAMVTKVCNMKTDRTATGGAAIVPVRRGLSGQSLLNNPMATLPSDMSGQTDVSTKDADDKDAPANDMLKEMFLLVQDSDGNIRLYDSRKCEIQALSLEMKILRNSKIILA